MNLVSSECIILRTQDFRERDKLVSFLTPDAGRVKGIVKGARKLTGRGVGSFEPFSRGVMHYLPSRAGDLATIRKCDPRPPYLYLQLDANRFLYAGYLAELVELCQIEAREARPYFELFADTLDALCENPAPRALPLLRLRFELRHLELLGYQPDWRHCVQCGKALLCEGSKGAEAASDGLHAFDVPLGGVRCPDCAPERPPLPLSPASLAFLENWRSAAPDVDARPTRRALEELEAAVSAHLVHHLERRPRSLALLPSLADLDAAAGAERGGE